MSIDVVVVLPCVPVTISVVRPAISLASTAGRSTTGMPRRRASTSSGLVFGYRGVGGDHGGRAARQQIQRRRVMPDSDQRAAGA